MIRCGIVLCPVFVYFCVVEFGFCRCQLALERVELFDGLVILRSRGLYILRSLSGLYRFVLFRVSQAAFGIRDLLRVFLLCR